MRRTNLKDVGTPNTPQEIKSLRRSVGDLLKAYGQPVVHMHVFNAGEINSGVAKFCPACHDDKLHSSRQNCTVCFGIGFVSVDDKPNTWIETDLTEVNYPTNIIAPLYGGFGAPTLTWVVEPDAALDVFKVNEQGVLIRTQHAQAICHWMPVMGDNDIMVNVSLANNGYTVNELGDRYELSAVQQNTMRGQGSRVRDPRFTINQTFDMNLRPVHDIRHLVPIGGVEWGKL